MTENVSTSERLIPILDSFTDRFHANFKGQHRLASPLGAWCLLAYIAINDDNPHPKVIESLGCSPAEAQEILTHLLKEQPKVVALAVKSWLNPAKTEVASVSSWSKEASAVVSPIKGIPTQNELNAWAKAESKNMIKEFPVAINPDLFLALFTNLVGAEVDWEKSYKAVPDDAMSSVWQVSNFLVSNKETFSSYIHKDETHGLFGVHRKFAKDGEFSVYSVMALDESVSEEVTMSVARKIASGAQFKLSAHELPLGESSNGALSVTAQKAESSQEIFTTYLPSWESSNSFNLLDTDLGFREGLGRFKDMGGNIGVDIEAKQEADAKYTAEGFKASSRTFGIVTLRSMPVLSCEIRHVSMRFNRPFAVVAAVDYVNKTWNRVPLFDGWVSKASEVTILRRG